MALVGSLLPVFGGFPAEVEMASYNKIRPQVSLRCHFVQEAVWALLHWPVV